MINFIANTIIILVTFLALGGVMFTIGDIAYTDTVHDRAEEQSLSQNDTVSSERSRSESGINSASDTAYYQAASSDSTDAVLGADLATLSASAYQHRSSLAYATWSLSQEHSTVMGERAPPLTT